MATKWEAIENGKRWAIFLVDPLGATHILSVSTTAFDQEGIARLAAAAPDLFAEGRECLFMIDALLKKQPSLAGTVVGSTTIGNRRALLNAALSKAESAQ